MHLVKTSAKVLLLMLGVITILLLTMISFMTTLCTGWMIMMWGSLDIMNSFNIHANPLILFFMGLLKIGLSVIVVIGMCKVFRYVLMYLIRQWESFGYFLLREHK